MLDSLVRDAAKVLTGNTKETKPYDTVAEVVRVEGDTAWVHISGGIDETPVDKTINAKTGDQVNIRVSGGKAWITGNGSAPPTDDTKANVAQTTATEAKTVADSAQADASRASVAADSAEASATAASEAATIADGKAVQAKDAADAAKVQAQNASEYASRALGNLSTVQSVSETLTWITQHGTMALTSDQQLDPTHVYFVVDANGDYVVGSTHYSVVTEPVTADIGTYYELSIDESLNNYVGTHLALDTEGLWLLPASSGTNKVLIATGAGSTYTTAGTYLVDSGGNTVASFRQDGATMSSGGTQIAHLGFGPGTDSGGGISDGPYYTLGVRAGTVGIYSVAEGYNTTASGYVSYSEGYYTTASAYGAHAEGKNTEASGDYSHAEGEDTEASGVNSHAEGFNTTASADDSHAEGIATTASGIDSHAEGYSTTASGNDSHAEGQGTTASATASHAGGYHTKASSPYQTVFGKYNIEDNSNTYACIIGNGTGDLGRSNALTVDWSGNVQIPNDAGYYGTKSDGTTQRILIGMSPANNVAVGYDSYTNADGNLNLYGDAVTLNSNTTITANQTITVGGNPMGLLAEEVLLADNITISGQTYGNGNASVSKTGYTPVGIVGIHLQNASTGGQNNTTCAMHSWYLSGSTAYWIVRGTSTATAKIKVTATILYVKS